MLKGTLDMMILRTPIGGDAHGHTIAKVIERTSEEVLEVEQGSLYPALHRLENRGWLSSYWGASENNRKPSTTASPPLGGAALRSKRDAGAGAPSWASSSAGSGMLRRAGSWWWQTTGRSNW